MPNTFSTTDPSTPGYFRIGFVVLQIPPTDISTNRVINDDQVPTLRTGTPMFVKSGQARWDVTVRWKAIRFENQDGTYDYSQWQDLRKVVAMFKAAPFVEIENDFLRQHFTNVHSAYKNHRMAFGLRQIRIDTNPDSTNVIDVTLTMSLFNYAPYSKDFGYVGSRVGFAVDASDSTSFDGFITSWIAQNMDTHPGSHSSPPITPWADQDEGTIAFKWRKYTYIPFKSTPAPAISNASAGYTQLIPTPRVPKKIGAKKLSNEIDQILTNAANKYGLDPAIVKAQCLAESGGDPNAGRGRTDHGGLGLMQLVASTAKQLGVADVFDPVQNADASCRYLKERLIRFGNYSHALGAYNAGDAYIYAYRDGKTQNHGKINPGKIKTSNGLPPPGIPHGEDTPAYVTKILTNAGRQRDIQPAPIKSTDGAPPQTPTSSSSLDIPDKAYLDAVTVAIKNLPPGDWWLDHYTESGAFFYEEEQILLASTDSPLNGDFDMYPNQISIAMVNNLPVIPLAGMQYPTFQHVGPTDTMISIGFHSVGDDNGVLSEPEHQGIQAITAMSSQLEDQFHALRTTFRAVSSIHRMQAVFIENQILNLLGIQGTMIRGINTETVPESAELVQASIMASQYENIFEDSTPFRLNGVAGAYSPQLKSILISGELSTLSKAEQNAVQHVKQFADAWAAKDQKFLLDQILSICSEPNDFLSDVNVPSAQLRPDQKNTLIGNLDLPIPANLLKNSGNLAASLTLGPGGGGQGILESAAGVGSSIASVATSAVTKDNQYQKDVYPGLERRRQILNKTTDMTFADYFVFSQLPIVSDSTLTASIRTSTDAKFSTTRSDIIDAMYQKLFDWEVLTDPLFNRQCGAITKSPSFKDRFDNAVKVEGPAVSDPNNVNHGCYKDLGLTDYSQDPAGYFVNYNEIIHSDTNNTLEKLLGTANQSAATVNSTQTVFSAGEKSTHPDSDGVSFTANTQGLKGGSSSLIRMTKLPAYSMNTAFPTYKLMLIEEDNTGPFFAFDNFYSYASVMDIEVIKYQDKPDTAIIQITNLAHLLQHRMYDDTAAGKMEREADRFNVDPSGALVTGGPNVTSNEAGTGGNPNAGIVASKTAAGQPYQKYPRKNMTEGRGEGYNRIPLKFFALQTGSKIQIRMGFSNNPDNLYPVFTGQVTSIEGDDILTLTCQSFMLELMNIPGTLVKKNTRLGFNFLSGGAAFGGYSMTSSGDTVNVMRTMLTAPSARHFGRWQIGGVKDPLLKGFEWTEVFGSAMESANSKTISAFGALLQTGYDRSGENILVNSVNNFDATKDEQAPANKGTRTWDNENPNWFLGTAKYSIDKQSKISVWGVLKDISRRYPYFNLMVREYGFPYAADATLVYGSTLDWYYCRPPLYGDAEKEKPNNVTQRQIFSQWWLSSGSAKWSHIFNLALGNGFSTNIIKDLQVAANVSIREAMSQAEGPMTELAGSGPEGFQDATRYMHNILSGEKSPDIPFLYSLTVHLARYGNIGGGLADSIDQNFQALYREWVAYLKTSEPASNSSRIKPIRQYHLIDYNHIVHNGITVNDDIYNAVKVKDEKPLKFNQNINDNHTRCLDVTDQINDPNQNVLQGVGNPLLNSYAQSFLREEVGKMYRGELILRGVPEIEPFDIILLSDVSTGMVGPIEVESVIHSFNIEQGYITIIKPKLLVVMNETASLGIIQSLGMAWSNASANLLDLGHIFNPLNVNTTTSARVVEVGALAAGALIGAAAFAWFPPVGITLGLLALVGGYGILMYAESRNQDNLFKIMPLSRFGRPWIGGLQGFAISDFAYALNTKFKWFDAEEIAPTIESWNEFLHYRSDYLLQQ